MATSPDVPAARGGEPSCSGPTTVNSGARARARGAPRTCRPSKRPVRRLGGFSRAPARSRTQLARLGVSGRPAAGVVPRSVTAGTRRPAHDWPADAAPVAPAPIDPMEPWTDIDDALSIV